VNHGTLNLSYEKDTMTLKIGTRGSRLALAQSEWVKKKIEARHPHIHVELVRIKTTGDKILDTPLSKIGGKALFVKEIEEALLGKIEEALLGKKVDLAVHSMKDVPAELPEGLMLSAFPEREDPRDAFVSVKYQTIQDLPQRAEVGTSSLRRAAQLLTIRRTPGSGSLKREKSRQLSWPLRALNALGLRNALPMSFRQTRCCLPSARARLDWRYGVTMS
jgi:hypothetical protein